MRLPPNAHCESEVQSRNIEARMNPPPTGQYASQGPPVSERNISPVAHHRVQTHSTEMPLETVH
jgi:hypothetical protein